MNWAWLGIVACMFGVGTLLQYRFDSLDSETIYIPLIQTAVGVFIGSMVFFCRRKLSKWPVTIGSRVKAALLGGFLAGIAGIVTGFFIADRILAPMCSFDGANALIFVIPLYGAYSAVIGIIFGAGAGQSAEEKDDSTGN